MVDKKKSFNAGEYTRVWRPANNSDSLLIQEAKKLGIECKALKHPRVFRFQYKKQVKYFIGRIPSSTTVFASFCCKNKNITNELLLDNKISVNKSFLINENDSKKYQSQLYSSLKKPLVLKPSDSSLGNNVILNISNKKDYDASIKNIFNKYSNQKVAILVEEMFQGEEYRILVTRKKILSVIHRLPANVVGDGESSIRKLIEEKNKNVIRKKIDTYKCIQVGAELKKYLSAQELSIVSVPKKEERIFLHPPTPSDMELGGDTIDITDSIHPSVKKIMLKVMQSIPGLELGGVDYMSKDIFSQQTPGLYRIIEINTSPDFSWNEFPLEGKRRNVSFEILKIMFPGLKK